MAANPISVHDIVAYLQIYPWHDTERFYTYVTHMDNVYLSEKAKQDEAKQKASKAKPKGR